MRWLLGISAATLVACGASEAPTPRHQRERARAPLAPESEPAPLTPTPVAPAVRSARDLATLVHSDASENWDLDAPPLDAREARPLLDIWHAFVEAIANRDGAAAVERMSQDTILFWSDVRTEALTPDAGGRLSVVERLYAEVARRLLPEAELVAIDGQGLLERAVEQGWAAPELLVGDLSSPVERVTLRHGGADLHTATERYGPYAHLDAWDGVWSVSFPYLLERFDGGTTDAATALGLTEDQYIDAVARGMVESLPR